MQVEVLLGQELGGDLERARLLPDVAAGRARRFLHDVAELSGEGDVSAAAGHQHRFDEEDVTARLRPGEPG